MFYHTINITKQAVHQTIERRMKTDEQHAYSFTIIQQIRADHPTLNCRAMYYKIQPEYIGRDKFESLCFQ